MPQNMTNPSSSVLSSAADLFIMMPCYWHAFACHVSHSGVSVKKKPTAGRGLQSARLCP